MEKRNNLKEWLLWLMVGVSLALMVYNTSMRWRSSRRGQQPATQIKNGTNLANFQLKNSNNEDFVIPNKGRHLLSFMTTECRACQRQVTSLNDVVKAKGSYDRVSAVFFEPANKVVAFQATFNPEFNCLLDNKGELASKLQINTYPQTIDLVDGVVVKSWVGLQVKFE